MTRGGAGAAAGLPSAAGVAKEPASTAGAASATPIHGGQGVRAGGGDCDGGAALRGGHGGGHGI